MVEAIHESKHLVKLDDWDDVTHLSFSVVNLIDIRHIKSFKDFGKLWHSNISWENRVSSASPNHEPHVVAIIGSILDSLLSVLTNHVNKRRKRISFTNDATS